MGFAPFWIGPSQPRPGLVVSPEGAPFQPRRSGWRLPPVSTCSDPKIFPCGAARSPDPPRGVVTLRRFSLARSRLWWRAVPLPGVPREGLLDLSPARSSPFLLVVRDDDFPLTTRSAAPLSPKGLLCCAALSGFRHLPRPQGVHPRSSPLRAFGVSALARPILPWAWFLSAVPDLRGVQPLARRSVRALGPGVPGTSRSFHSHPSRETRAPLAPGCFWIDDRRHLTFTTPTGRPPRLFERPRRTCP